MTSLRLGLVLVLAMQRVAALPPIGSGLAAWPTRSLPGARDNGDDFEVADLSFITKMAAIGDSYSAGIGAGNTLTSTNEDWECRRSDSAYPYLINTDARLGDGSSKRNFQFKSCSSAVTDDVISNQIPSLDDGQQVILLSIGGNDAGLEDILNQCIYQWASFNSLQATVGWLEQLRQKLSGKAGFGEWFQKIDFQKLSRGCDGQLDDTNDIINSDEFSKNLDSVLNNAKSKLSSDGMIYYTGYAKFFAEDMSPACDRVTWSTFTHKAYNIFLEPARLTVDKRTKMNNLVDAVNKKLEEAVSRAGEQVRFVNYDDWVGRAGGRYCEAGVDESGSYSENTNENLMFYELNMFDPLGFNPYKRDTRPSPEKAFDGTINAWAHVAMEADPNTEFAEKQFIDDANPGTDSTSSFSVTEGLAEIDDPDSSVPNLLPVGYGRVFHPQIKLHLLIANMVIWAMIDENSQKHGGESVPEIYSATETACPVKKTGSSAQACKADSDCPGMELCKKFFLSTVCNDGKCACGAPPKPTSTATVATSTQNKYLPTATPDPPIQLIGSDTYNLATYPSCLVSDSKSYGQAGIMVQPCHQMPNYKAATCAMGTVSDNLALCVYTSMDCTGDKYIEFLAGDKSLKWVGGEDGKMPELLWSWDVKDGKCG